MADRYGVKRLRADSARRLRRNRIGMLVGVGLILLSAVGEWLGWWAW